MSLETRIYPFNFHPIYLHLIFAVKFECDMTAFCSSLSNFLGNDKNVAPLDGRWVETSPRQFEELVRSLAYGLMVKDYRSGGAIAFSDCTEEMKPFLSTACMLSHLEARFSPADDCLAELSANDISYLMTIGSTWSRKYKAAVDRTIARMVLG